MSNRRAAGSLLALLLLGAGGCGGSLTTSAAGRLESPAASTVSRGAAVQAAPTVTWQMPSGTWTGAMGYAPTVLLEAGASPLIRHRATLSVASGRVAGLHPYGHLSMDYGAVRPNDVTGEDTLEPFPGGEALRSYSVGGEGGLTGHLDRRTELRVSAGANRSAGVGSSASTLPELTRAHVGVRGQRQRTRAQSLDGGVQLVRYALGEPSLLLEGDVRATLRLTEALSVSGTLGGAAVSAPGGNGEATAGPKPIAGLAARYVTPARRGPTLALSLNTRPAFDRLDGTLRQRLLGQISADTPLTGSTRVTTVLNWSVDVSGAGPLRRILTADAALTTTLPSDWLLVLGLRAFIQGTSSAPGTSDPSESRLQLGLSRSWTLR